MNNKHLDTFVLMAIKKKILIELCDDEIINSIGEKSKLLNDLLL
jgi:hypothetical protein